MHLLVVHRDHQEILQLAKLCATIHEMQIVCVWYAKSYCHLVTSHPGHQGQGDI